MEKNFYSFDELPRAVSQIGEQLNAIHQMLTQRIEPQQSTNQNQLLSVREAAALLRLTVPTIYSKVSKGELPAMKQGNRLYFSLAEVTDYLKLGKKKSNAEIQTEADAYLSIRKKGGRHE